MRRAPTSQEGSSPGVRATPTRSTHSSYLLVGALATAFVASVLYVGTLQHYFAADDFIFLHQLHFAQPHFADSFVYFGHDWGLGADFYRPLVRLLWAAEYSFFGENAPGWHLVGLLLYGLTSALVFLLAWQLSRRLPVALIAGFTFVAHPAHAETVSWISNQSDLLVGIFCLLAAICYLGATLRHARAPLGRFLCGYASALAFFFLALLSKESAAGFVFVPLAADLIFSIELFRRGETGQHAHAWLRLFLRQLPFWAVLLAYLWLRVNALGGVGGYSPGSATFVPWNIFARSYASWLLMPLQVNLRGLLLLAIVALTAFVFLVRDEIRLSARQGDATYAVSALVGRAAVFGVCWMLLFLLPTVTTPPSVRFAYLSTIGIALTAAALLTPIIGSTWSPWHPGAVTGSTWVWRATDAIKLLAAGALLIVSIFSTLGHEGYWLRAGQTTQSILRQIRDLRPDLVNYSYVYAAALPEANEEALIFRTGFPQAVQIEYGNATIQGISAPSFPVVEQHLSQAYFVEYKGGAIVARDDIVQTLEERNISIKKGTEVPYLTWDFASAQQSAANSPAAGWTLAGGGGLALNKDGLQVEVGNGALLQTPPLLLPAPAMSDFQLTLRATSASSATTDPVYIVHWLVSTPAGNVERASAPLAVKSDGELHTYKIKPPDISAFFYNDTVSQLRLEIPSTVADVLVKGATLYRLP